MLRGRGAHCIHMKHYELTYLTSTDLSDEELKSFQKEINSSIQAEGGQVAEANVPIKRELSLPKKGKNEIYLISLNFQLNPEKVTILEKKLKSDSKIFHYLILSKKPLKATSLARTLTRSKRKPKVELKEIEEKLKEIIGE